jgi:Uma2 family endonuclease
MVAPAAGPRSLEEFLAASSRGAYEWVEGNLEELPPNGPRHGWTVGRLCSALGTYLDIWEPAAYCGVSLVVPTLPLHARRPDLTYYSPGDTLRGLRLDEDRVTGTPTLVVEVTSLEDETRDRVTKWKEYAQVGIPHYWILTPHARAAVTLVLREGRYEVAGSFSGEDTLTSELFPGLEIPLHRLFR